MIPPDNRDKILLEQYVECVNGEIRITLTEDVVEKMIAHGQAYIDLIPEDGSYTLVRLDLTPFIEEFKKNRERTEVV